MPFDRMRQAAESELGTLSSVDVQLLRLELSDERGKMTKLALKVCANYSPAALPGSPKYSGKMTKLALKVCVRVRLLCGPLRTCVPCSHDSRRVAARPTRSL